MSRIVHAAAEDVPGASGIDLMVGTEQACMRTSRLAAFGATNTISQLSARRSAVRRPCREDLMNERENVRTQYALAVDLKTANALRLSIPESILLRAGKMIR